MDKQEDIQSFIFSAKVATDSASLLSKKLQAYEQRLDRIVEKVLFADINIIKHLLTMSQDPKEYYTLGKALVRISEILPEMSEVKKNYEVASTVSKNPSLAASLFADFTEEIDSVAQVLTTETGEHE